MSYPPFRSIGDYRCIFGINPFGPSNPDYNPVGGYAPMGTPVVPWAVGAFVSPTQITCLSPSWQYPLTTPGDPPQPINGPVDVVVVDQNSTDLPLVESPPGSGVFHVLNVAFYQPATWSWLQPQILSLTPATGSGYGFEPFTVTGNNFYPGHIGAGGGEANPNRIHFGPMAVDAAYVDVHTLVGHTPGYFRCTALVVDVTLTPPGLPSWLNQQSTIRQPDTTLPAAYAYDSTWWKYTGIAMWWAYLTCETLLTTVWPFPGGDVDYKFLDRLPPFDWQVKKPQSPGPGWTNGPPPDDPNGWWSSFSEFRGDVMVIAHGRPANPRTWHDVGGFAAGSAGMLGGSPGLATTFRNRLIYAATGYTADPPIRMFDGSYDRELATVPPTAAGHAHAVMALLTANGSIYVSTWDAGTDGATWTGRVFLLDIETAVLSPLGKPFPAGHLPYALAWHNGRLWCGSHRGATAGAGKIFSLNPLQQDDAVWVEDHDLGTVQSVAAMYSFQGKLYIGTTGGAGVFGTLIARAPDGTYATADIGAGGTATATNGYLSLMVFKDALYAAFWNNGSPAVATIRRSPDGVAWTTSYTGAARTLRPFITLGIDAKTLFAVGGGLGLPAAILSTTDGTTWLDLTDQLPEADKTALPAFGGVGY